MAEIAKPRSELRVLLVSAPDGDEQTYQHVAQTLLGSGFDKDKVKVCTLGGFQHKLGSGTEFDLVITPLFTSMVDEGGLEIAQLAHERGVPTVIYTNTFSDQYVEMAKACGAELVGIVVKKWTEYSHLLIEAIDRQMAKPDYSKTRVVLIAGDNCYDIYEVKNFLLTQGFVGSNIEIFDNRAAADAYLRVRAEKTDLLITPATFADEDVSPMVIDACGKGIPAVVCTWYDASVSLRGALAEVTGSYMCGIVQNVRDDTAGEKLKEIIDTAATMMGLKAELAIG